MTSLNTRICGGHLEIEFTANHQRAENGALVVGLSPRRMLWDGEPVPGVVAEALAVAWCAAQPDEDGEDD